MEKLVIIPTYNERENISKMISKVMSLEGGYHLLVVDDGSPDGTGAIVRLARTMPYSKWTAIFRTIPTICCGLPPNWRLERMSPSVRVIRRG